MVRLMWARRAGDWWPRRFRGTAEGGWRRRSTLIVLVSLALLGAEGRASNGPLRLEIRVDRTTYTAGWIVTGQVLVENTGTRPLRCAFQVRLAGPARMVAERRASLVVAPGGQRFSLEEALGFLPLVPAEEGFVGQWRLQVTADEPGCEAQASQIFRVIPLDPGTGLWAHLQASWRLNEGQGAVARDETGSVPPTSIGSATWVAGRFGAGLRIPGGKGITFLVPPFSLAAEWTVSLWLKIPAAGEGTCGILAVVTQVSEGPGARIGLHRGRMALLTQGGPAGPTPQAEGKSSALEPGNWHHVSLVSWRGGLALYLDGKPAAAGRVPGALTGMGGLILGSPEGWGLRGCDEVVADELRLFDRALSEAEQRVDRQQVLGQQLEVTVDPGKRKERISPLLFGVNVEGGEPFHLPPTLRATLVRWPGGCYAEGYHWRDAVGPRRKATLNNICLGNEQSKSPRLNPVGTDEFLQSLERIGAQGLLAVNFGTGTAREAANWVEYVNGVSPGLAAGRALGWTPDSFGGADEAPPGYFAWLRETFGRREPYRVTSWAVGNEFEAWSGPSWTRDVLKYYRGGTDRLMDQPLTRDPERRDWDQSKRKGSGGAAERFYPLHLPVVPGSQRVEVVGPDSAQQTGQRRLWTETRDPNRAGSAGVYRIDPATGAVAFGNGSGRGVPAAGSQVRMSYETGPHDGFIAFVRAMKAVDPSIKVGTAAALSPIPSFAAPYVDFVAANYYGKLPKNDPDPVLRHSRSVAMPVLEMQPHLERIRAYLRRDHAGVAIAPCVTEYNINLDNPDASSMSAVVFVADLLRVLAAHGVPLAAYYSLPYLVHQEPGPPFLHAPGVVLALLREQLLGEMVEVQIRNRPEMTVDPDGTSQRFPMVEALASADSPLVRSALLLINKSASDPAWVRVRIPDWEGTFRVVRYRVAGDGPLDRNTPEQPGRIRAVASEGHAHGGTVSSLLPPSSVTVIVVTRQ